MGSIEQVTCELPGPDGRAVALLARSAGIIRPVGEEVLTLCARWNPPALDQAARALLGAPLSASTPGVDGRLYVAARAVAAGPGRLLVHALVLTEEVYAARGFSPFRLEREGLFARRPTTVAESERPVPGMELSAPLVEIAPNEVDAELVEGALRLYFATGRLIVPVAKPEPASDRFLALLLESLPLNRRRNLVLATIAPAGHDTVNLGAVCMADGSFQLWRRSLAGAVRRQHTPEIETYLGDVRRHLAAGDLASLDATSRASGPAPVSADRPLGGDARAASLVGAVVTSVAPTPELLARQRAHSGPDSQVAAPSRGDCPPVRPARAATPDRRPRVGSSGGRIWIGLLAAAALVVTIVIVAGRRPAGDVADAGARGAAGAVAARPAATAGPVTAVDAGNPRADDQPAAVAAGGLGGVIAVGPLYASEFEVYARAATQDTSAARRHEAAGRALSALRERGADDLRRQARDYCAEAARDLAAPPRPDREAAAARQAAQLGATLVCETRRCVLAAYGLGRNSPWADLGALPDAALKARWDSLRRRDAHGLEVAAAGLDMAGLADRVAAARDAAVSRGRLAGLLAQPRRDGAWLSALDLAAAELDVTTLPPGLAAWRADALDLARLKRAEDDANLGALALTEDYAGEAWFPAAMREALAALQATVATTGAEMAPPIVRATLDLHAGLARARVLAAGDPPAGELDRALAELAGSAALQFDPASYADHLDRIRMLALTTLLAGGRAPDAVPLPCFPQADRRTALGFVALERKGAGADDWNGFAAGTPVPFLARWARARAANHGASRAVAGPDAFDAEFQALAGAAADLAAQAQRGQDWSGRVVAVRETAADFVARYPERPSTSADRRERLARVKAFVAALDQPLTIPLARAEVRLDGGLMTAPAEVGIELIAAGGDVLYRSPALLTARDPAGDWRVVVEPGPEIALRPGQPVRAVVSWVTDGRPVFTARYDKETVAPGGFLRPATGPAEDGVAGRGSIVFAVPDWSWRRLRVPDLRAPAAAAAAMP